MRPKNLSIPTTRSQTELGREIRIIGRKAPGQGSFFWAISEPPNLRWVMQNFSITIQKKNEQGQQVSPENAA
jgi:hypothetical protein